MTAPRHLVVVSPPGSGTVLLHQITTALGHTSRGTMGGHAHHARRAAPGEVYPLLETAYGRPAALAFLTAHHREQDTGPLQAAYTAAVDTLWRVWWQRLGQAVTAHTDLDPAVESRLARLPNAEVLRLLPGRDAWYVTDLRLDRADAGLLRHWAATGEPLIILHRRHPDDRIAAHIRHLCRPDGQVGTMPENLIHRDVLTSLPTDRARWDYARADPAFLGATGPSLWLSHHPGVLTVTHEELAGPLYGGTPHARAAALARLTTALGHPADRAGTLPDPVPGLPDLHIGLSPAYVG
ncbi:hypothetical protein [Streptomyces sp. UH6]|uniref:hypothetical protein n=1 Tax=Streptomyces sp. UH6 TaxID=2748379 RepID=UPI0015D4A4FA|nr:hypothetical protein [Streptomyces sp. UH6]NYV73409.1 hypothetical protein [Streptomyces sp. UH6]